jgi:hypothetical protein
MNMILVNLPSFNCPFANLRPVPKAIILHSVGHSLLALLCILYLISKLFLIFRRSKSDSNGPATLQYIATTRSDRNDIGLQNRCRNELLRPSLTFLC